MQRYHYKREDPGGAEFDDISVAENIDTVDWCADPACTRRHLYVLSQDEYQALRDHIIGLGRGYIGTSDDDDHYDADIVEQFRA